LVANASFLDKYIGKALLYLSSIGQQSVRSLPGLTPGSA